MTMRIGEVLTMDEYIRKEDVIELFMPYAHAGESIDADVVISDIKGMKAADVAPVRHGRWIYKGECAVCTECGGRSGTQYDGVEPIPLMTQFCPNCGCRMDGGDDE